jgi:DNA-directed RNA polymerase subunit K
MTEKFQYTKFERARIIGARALQISANAPIILKLDKETLESINYDPIKIAEMEFDEEVLPITVHRPLPKKMERKSDIKLEMIEQEIEEIEKPKEEIKKTEEKEEDIPEVKKVEVKKEPSKTATTSSADDDIAKEFEAEEEKEEEMPEEDAGESF